MEDRQQQVPAAWCRWCGRELYPGEEGWELLGATLHEDCLGEYARANCRHWVLEERRGIWE